MAGIPLGEWAARFNPHPSRRTGATFDGSNWASWAGRVSILTRPEGRVQLLSARSASSFVWFQSSPVPKDGCNMSGCSSPPACLAFQSSPVPKDGCNAEMPTVMQRAALFQSSPVPKDGCN